MKELEQRIVAALHAGKIEGFPEAGAPSEYLETGLAHLFFYPERVYKLYKAFHGGRHPATDALADTKTRRRFLTKDFERNVYFSKGVYQQSFAVVEHSGRFTLQEDDGVQPFVLFQMKRINTAHNLHYRLVHGETTAQQLYTIGFELARLVATYPHAETTNESWYELSMQRIRFLEQFLAHAASDVIAPDRQAAHIARLRSHVDQYRADYERMRGPEHISICIDSHDENVFWNNGNSIFVDVLPPMPSWWFSVPWLNMFHFSVSAEVLGSERLARAAEEGFSAYHGRTLFTERDRCFARAFVILLAIAHHASPLQEKNVLHQYAARCDDILAEV